MLLKTTLNGNVKMYPKLMIDPSGYVWFMTTSTSGICLGISTSITDFCKCTPTGFMSALNPVGFKDYNEPVTLKND